MLLDKDLAWLGLLLSAMLKMSLRSGFQSLGLICITNQKRKGDISHAIEIFVI